MTEKSVHKKLNHAQILGASSFSVTEQGDHRTRSSPLAPRAPPSRSPLAIAMKMMSSNPAPAKREPRRYPSPLPISSATHMAPNFRNCGTEIIFSGLR